jgi:hypothetical protein
MRGLRGRGDGGRTTSVHATPYTLPGVGARIDLGCNTLLPTVSGNTFLGLPIALNNMPAGMSLQKSAGSYVNVPTMEQPYGLTGL